MNNQRLAGVVLPLFSIRRNNDHGIGDLIALREWIDWAAFYGVGFLQLLPVNALGSDETPSPYSAISSVALEPLYIALEPWVLPGMKERVYFDVKHATHHQFPHGQDLVDYPAVRAFKYRVLRDCWENFSQGDEFSVMQDEFHDWCSEQDQWLEDYACYKVLSSLFGTDIWWHWPEQNPDTARRIASEHAEEKEFEKWLQWVAFRQYERLREYADDRGVALMGDIPIGVSMASSDVFFERHLFDTSWCGGAPAEGAYSQDPFTAKWGQNWGIPLYRWDVMARDNYAWWRRRIRKTTQIFSIYRIDHILGFYRIYAFPWKPTENDEFLPLSYEEAAQRTGGRLPGFKPRDDNSKQSRKDNLMDGDKYLRMLLSAAPGVRVVGEDLGCVPDYVRPDMSQLRIAGFKIPHWEIKPDGHIVKGDEYSPCSFATYGTHDFCTIMDTWNGAYESIKKAEEAGVYSRGVLLDNTEEKYQEIRTNAENGLRLLAWFADYAGADEKALIRPWDSYVKDLLFKALFRSNAQYAALLWTELFDVNKRLNVPGTVGGTNWRVRMNFKAVQVKTMPQSSWIQTVIEQSNRLVPNEKKGVDSTEWKKMCEKGAIHFPFDEIALHPDIVKNYYMNYPYAGRE
jgi:4-alpha-glucanotransferase